MLSVNEIASLNQKFIESKNEEALALLITIEQLQKTAFENKQNVFRKLTALEEDMNRLVEENQRLIALRDSAYFEKDASVSLLVKLAAANGFTAGVVPGNRVVLELKSGQVSWEFEETESHLFEGLPAYSKPVEEIDIVENYRRVMNSGI